MKNYSLTLCLEINNTSYIFFVTQNDDKNNFKIVYSLETPLIGIENNRITDLEKIFDVIKKNVYIAEQKLNCTFKEVVLILDNFNPSFVNLTGYKKLNGSQILRENITYILNTLKSCVDETELKKTVLHIFNSKFSLDNKKIKNLPIGLFGDFYSHELSFTLINTNDYKNLKQIFDKSNLKIKKILLKSFILGVYLSDDNPDIDTFFHIEIRENNSKIIFFENNSLKFSQEFNFGSNIIIKDISKITALEKNVVKEILNNNDFNDSSTNEEIINKDIDDTILILNADILEKKSKIRNFFEKSKKLVCVAFYPDEFRNLSFILQNFLKEKKLKISQESANLIIERSNGSRDHLKNELKKIEIYALNKKEIHLSEIIKLTNLGKNYNISELVESCLAKNHKKISKIINENNFSNEDTIIIIRTFLLKAKRLLNLSRNLEVEKNLDDVVSKYKPPIFWKEKEVVKLQLNLWSMSDLKKLIYEVNNTELLIKKNINISLNVLLDFIFKNSKLVSN